MILEISKKEEWNQVLSEIGYYDCYHTYDYHCISRLEGETPILIVYRSEKLIVALPLMIRSIKNTVYSDVTSVYGYPGPIFKKLDRSVDFSSFRKELKDYLHSKNVVSVFSRLNPFIKDQEDVLENMGSVNKVGNIVNIDLTQDIEIQRQLFSKTTKRYINKSRKFCSVKKSKEEKDLLTFIDLYYENMDRVNAKKSYYFEKEYFFRMACSTDFETDVVFAMLKDTGEIISAAMMMKTNNIVQYHISGTRNDYLNITPIRLLLDETRIEGTEQKYRYFNLGGGLGGEKDSLFNFKASFSKDFKEFKVWKYIVNDEVYNELSKAVEKSTDFFPLYRYDG